MSKNQFYLSTLFLAIAMPFLLVKVVPFSSNDTTVRAYPISQVYMVNNLSSGQEATAEAPVRNTVTDQMVENKTYWVDYLNDNTQSEPDPSLNNMDEISSTPEFWPKEVNRIIENESDPVEEMQAIPYYWIRQISDFIEPAF